MKRKIIKQGHNTLTMTLPRDWVSKLNLNAGDEVDVLERENALVINGHQNLKQKKVEVDITDFTLPLLWRYFQSTYRAGCDEIRIKFDPNKKKYDDAFHFYTTQFEYQKLGEKIPQKPAIAMIQELVDRFIGMAIMESGEGYCVIKEMGEVSKKEFDNSLRRIFLVLLQLFDRVIEAIEKNEVNDAGLCKEIHTIDLNVDKFVDYCGRILNKVVDSVLEDQKPLMFSTLFLLELLGDEFKYIGKHLAFSDKPVKEVLNVAKLVKEHFELYYALFYKYDRDTAIRFGKNDALVYATHFKIKGKIYGEARSILKHFMGISKFVFALGELRIQMEF